MSVRDHYVLCGNVRFAPAVRGGVLDAPRSRDRRASLDTSVRRGLPHPRHHGAPAFVYYPTHAISRAQPAHHCYGRTKVVLQPAPGGRGSPPLRGIRSSPTSPSTPQSRRKAPRQLPFQGRRGMGRGLRRLRICLPRCRNLRLAPAVRGGVLDAPRLPDCRGGSGADVRRDQWHPCLPQCAILASTTQRMQYRGRSPRTIVTGVGRFPFTHAGRAWKPSPTRYPEFTHVGLNPSVTPLRAATAPLSGEPRGWEKVSNLTHILPMLRIPTFR